LLSAGELEGCLEQALLQAERAAMPLAVLCAYRVDLKLSPHPAAEVAATAAITIHNLTRPSDYTAVLDDIVVVILPETTVAGAWVVAERIGAALRARQGTKPWRVTPVTHAEQFGSAARLMQAIRRLTSEFAA
jgi:hypothetical protein